MATWTDIDASRLEPGKPIRSIDGLALRDNPIAIAEGAAGAPKIQEPALGDGQVSTRALANAAVTSAKLAATGNETNWVLGRTAAGGLASVGTYALCKVIPSGLYGPGSTIAGSSLAYADTTAGSPPSPIGFGTWRCMGNVGSHNAVTLFQRVA